MRVTSNSHISLVVGCSSKVGNILTNVTGLCINLKIDGDPMGSHTDTHPSQFSHSQTSVLLFTSLSLGTSFPGVTQNRNFYFFYSEKILRNWKGIVGRDTSWGTGPNAESLIVQSDIRVLFGVHNRIHTRVRSGCSTTLRGQGRGGCFTCDVLVDL